MVFSGCGGSDSKSTTPAGGGVNNGGDSNVSKVFIPITVPAGLAGKEAQTWTQLQADDSAESSTTGGKRTFVAAEAACTNAGYRLPTPADFTYDSTKPDVVGTVASAPSTDLLKHLVANGFEGPSHFSAEGEPSVFVKDETGTRTLAFEKGADGKLELAKDESDGKFKVDGYFATETGATFFTCVKP